MSGWIKLHRELTDKAIWQESTPEQKTILITLLMMANHQEKEWEWKGKRYKAEPGQFVTSLESIVKKCGKGITVQNVRTALKRFEKYEFLTNQSTNKNRLITVVNWEVYQNKDSEVTSKITSNQQATNKQLTTNKNDKNDKELYISIVEYLNLKAGTKYKSDTKKTISLIDSRLKEGFTLDDFKRVIDNKISTWKGTEWEKYLRPETLFGNKFEGYLNEKNLTKETEETPKGNNWRGSDKRL